MLRVIKRMEFVDFTTLDYSDCPYIILVSHTNKFISWIIRWHTKGSYNHAMLLTGFGEVLSQDLFLRKVPLEKYLKSGYKLKVWKVDYTEDDKKNIRNSIIKDLAKPLWHRRYDFLGIIGQFFGLRKINNPFTNFCSENVAKYLRLILPNIPAHPSPEELNELFKKRDEFVLQGYYFKD